MSFPVEIRDELLTGYLDGQLSQDERHRVERMLETDQEAREVFERLSANRDVLRQLGGDAPGLGGAFAERVWAATQAAAREEGLADSHPVRLAESLRPKVDVQRRLRGRWKIAGSVMAVLAASLLIGLTVFQTVVTDSGPEMARNDRDQDEPALVENGEAESQPTAEEQLDRSGIDETQRDALVENSAQPQPSISPGDLPGDVGGRETPSTEPLVADASRSDDATQNDQPAESRGAYDALAELLPGRVESREAEPSGSDGPNAAPEAMAAGGALQAVLMYEVALTQRGVTRGILDHALSEAGIELGDQGVLDAQAVESLAAVQLATPGEAAVDVGEGAQLWFIEAPMQRIDYLLLTLAAAHEDVERVGYKLLRNPPVVSAARQIAKVDPVAIQQPGGANLAIQLAFESAGRRADEFVVAGDLGTAAMRPRSVPTKQEYEAALRDADTEIGPVLLLVRSPQEER